ncbi:MAG TPA: type II secretion system minor pseudopilin GspI [Steroidobacteraceae bacterium]|nr:type II secretion system minor pseudopilin GspI [Steroidobacteraceae bacterium]
MRRVRRRAGFTLIEVLVALAIVAIGMAAVLGALTSSADTIAYLRDKTFAQWVALNQIATVRLSGQVPAVGNSDGDIDFAGRSWHWRQEVTATQVPGAVRIDVMVRPKDVKGDDDKGWFTTVSGIQGDAVGAANGYQPDWGSQMLPGQMQAPTQGGLGSGTPGGLGSPTQGGLGSGNLGTPGAFGQSPMGSGGIGSQGGIGAPDTLMGPQTPSTPPTDPGTPDSQQ